MQAFIIRSFKGQAGVVKTTVNDTSKPFTTISFTIFNVTRSLPRSGSCTLLSAAKISSFVIVQFFVKKPLYAVKLAIDTLTLFIN